MKIAPNEQRRLDALAIREFIAAQADGDTVSWNRIADETKVAMDLRGRTIVREVLRSLGRDYLPVPGEAIVLSSEHNATEIMNRRFRGIASAVKRAERSRERLTDRHYDKMDAHTQAGFVALAGLAGQIVAIGKVATASVLSRFQLHGARAIADKTKKRPPGL